VLHDVLLIAIRDNWDRIRYEYTAVMDWLEREEKERDIDRALLVEFRKDLRSDGSFFIDTPDGIGSRLKDWINRAFPRAFE
jgi:hypothetical protein